MESDQQLQVRFMMSGTTDSITVPSTLSRELLFVAHHGMHHISTIKQLVLSHHQRVAFILNQDAYLSIGKAPSTVQAERV